VPIYDYRCTECKEEIYDVWQKISDPPIIYCPSCCNETLVKKPAVFAQRWTDVQASIDGREYKVSLNKENPESRYRKT